tara:strand:+ start:16447 stop:16689 length:243 start_codon:yes stop_codon:yes gene_type:complete
MSLTHFTSPLHAFHAIKHPTQHNILIHLINAILIVLSYAIWESVFYGIMKERARKPIFFTAFLTMVVRGFLWELFFVSAI